MKLTPQEKIDLSKEILRIVITRIGKPFAIRRPELLFELQSRGWDISDRTMRLSLEYLREYEPKGARICASVDGEGYYYASSLDELRDALASDINRARNINIRVATQLRRAFPELAGQLSMGGA
jgi:hypothetical protein